MDSDLLCNSKLAVFMTGVFDGLRGLLPASHVDTEEGRTLCTACEKFEVHCNHVAFQSSENTPSGYSVLIMEAGIYTLYVCRGSDLSVFYHEKARKMLISSLPLETIETSPNSEFFSLGYMAYDGLG